MSDQMVHRSPASSLTSPAEPSRQFDPDLDGGSDAGRQEESDDDEGAADEFRPDKQALREAARETADQRQIEEGSSSKLPKIKKKKRSAEDGEAEAAPRRKKKRAAQPVDDEPEEILTPEEGPSRATLLL